MKKKSKVGKTPKHEPMAERPDVNAFRRKDMTIKELESLAEQMQDSLSSFIGVIAGMKIHKLPSVYVDGAKKIPIGLRSIDAGVHNLKVAVTLAREGLTK